MPLKNYGVLKGRPINRQAQHPKSGQADLDKGVT